MAKVYNGVALKSIVRGQAWHSKRSALNRTDARGIVRVMTVSDGYAMVRYKGCMPFTVFWKDLIVNYTRTPAFDSSDAAEGTGK